MDLGLRGPLVAHLSPGVWPGLCLVSLPTPVSWIPGFSACLRGGESIQKVCDFKDSCHLGYAACAW